MIRLPALGALLALALPTSAALARDNEDVTHFTLNNGMEVVVVEDHRAPSVQQMVWYRAGSADEPKGSSGVAHFLEHLLFKATDKMDAGEFSATVAKNGGRDNAFTSYDYTAYFQRVAADRLELMMQMESDRMKNIRLTPENIATERDVIIEERNQRTENDPSALFREQLNAAQYLNHRYGTPVIGWMHEMRELDLQDALDFYKLYYSPNNAILVVSGDVEPDNVRQLAEQYYGEIPANPELPERLRTQEPPQTAERRLTFRDDRVAQEYVSRSYLAQERDPGDQKTAAALTILAELLGGGTTSYFAEKLQFDTSIATYSAAFYSGQSLDDTTFNIVVVPQPGVSLQDAEDAMDAAVAGFMKDGVDAEQLERIKQQVRAEQIYARDNADSVANRYGSALAIGLSVQDVQDWPDVLEAVTADDIMQAAKDVFNREASVTGWLMREEVTE
ncbi:MAG: insulinase family protein [Sulfitobacter litoralis]|uniref:Zinc protease n=1 Tax=Sulfitobacter litoralis TaxID=335975 RepID=A0ABY0SU37_9RHOB|nr:pitrilysin family protein [Sulfitobacter litoralis]MBQ0716728.1 insulinase family protein [Sulfitobacter litoralis]MBQ0802701.1 insulinase family protein [Sulfitobacter litoralis]SDP60366.1 zinc protease [Sulfitobacter litoralis]